MGKVKAILIFVGIVLLVMIVSGQVGPAADITVAIFGGGLSVLQNIGKFFAELGKRSG